MTSETSPPSSGALKGVPAVSAPQRKATPVLSDIARTPYPSWTTSAALLAAIPATVRAPLGFPHLVQLPLFAAVFGGTGYMVSAGDAVNGPGTATAWSLIYLFLNGKRALLSKRPGPIAVSSIVASLAASSGYDYFVNA